MFLPSDVVPLAYILAGVLIGVLLILIIGVLVFVYHRRKKSSLSKSVSGDITCPICVCRHDNYSYILQAGSPWHTEASQTISSGIQLNFCLVIFRHDYYIKGVFNKI